jgi:hypothetical protein
MLVWFRKHNLALLLFVLAIALTVVIWKWPDLLEETSLSLQLTSNTNLVSPEANQSGKIEVQFEGLAVPELWLGSFRLVNDGDVPIRREDFDQPIRLVHREANILELRLGMNEPPNLSPYIYVGLNSIEIQPLLLNPGDSVGFSLITTKSMASAVPSVRIAGIKEINFISQVSIPGSEHPQSAWLGIVNVILTVVTWILFLILALMFWEPIGRLVLRRHYRDIQRSEAERVQFQNRLDKLREELESRIGPLPSNGQEGDKREP